MQAVLLPDRQCAHRIRHFRRKDIYYNISHCYIKEKTFKHV